MPFIEPEPAVQELFLLPFAHLEQNTVRKQDSDTQIHHLQWRGPALFLGDICLSPRSTLMKKSLHKGKTENNPQQIWKATLILVKMVQIKDELKLLFFISGQRKPETFVSGTDTSRQS